MPTQLVSGIWIKLTTWWIAFWWSRGPSCLGQLRRPKISTPHLKREISRQIHHEPVAFQAHPHSSHVSQPLVPSLLLFVLFLVCVENTNYAKRFVTGRGKMPSFCPGDELFTFTSQPQPEFRFCFQHFEHPCRRPNRTVWSIYNRHHQLCWRLWSTKYVSPYAYHNKINITGSRLRGDSCIFPREEHINVFIQNLWYI